MERLLPYSIHCRQRLLLRRNASSQADEWCSAPAPMRPSANNSPLRTPRAGVAVCSLTQPATTTDASVCAPLIRAASAPFTSGEVSLSHFSNTQKYVDSSPRSTAAPHTRWSATTTSALSLEGTCVRLLAGVGLNPAAASSKSMLTLGLACRNGKPVSVHAYSLPPHDAACCRDLTLENINFDATAEETHFETRTAFPFQSTCSPLARSRRLTLRPPGATSGCSAFSSLYAAFGAKTRGLGRHSGQQRQSEYRISQFACMSWRYQQQADGKQRSWLRRSGKNCVEKSFSSLGSSNVWTAKTCYVLSSMERSSRLAENAVLHFTTRSLLWFSARRVSRLCLSASTDYSRSDVLLCGAKAKDAKGRVLSGDVITVACQRHQLSSGDDPGKGVSHKGISKSSRRNTGYPGTSLPASSPSGIRHVRASEASAWISASSALISHQTWERRLFSSKCKSSAEKTYVAVLESHDLSPVERRDVGEALQHQAFSAMEPYAGDKATFLKERYGPPKDPSTLLIEPHRLTKEEQFFQKLFVVLPGVALLMMLATPVALVRYHVRKLQERMACTEEVAEELASDLCESPFQDCDFFTLRNVVEQPTHAFVFYFHPESLSSQVVGPLLRDIAELFRKLRVRVTVAAVDLADKSIPDAMRRMFPVALAPHGELLLPYALDGQQPALQLYDGEWEAQNIVRAVAQEVPAAAGALAAAKEKRSELVYQRVTRAGYAVFSIYTNNATLKLNDWTEGLSDCLFALRFVDDRPGDEVAVYQQGEAFYSGPQDSGDIAAAAAADRFVEERARAIGLAKGGLQEALQECKSAREKLRLIVQQHKQERI